ncbi:MAG: bifunctional diguanylate cyclase/phosphodiesterase [Aquisalimonadaceae bacterium]
MAATTINPDKTGGAARVAERRITEDLTRQLYESMQGLYSAAAITVLLIAALVWNDLPRPMVLAWVCVMLTLEVLLTLLTGLYSRHHQRHDTNFWLRRFAILHYLASAGWGALSIFLLMGLTDPLKLSIALIVFAVGAVGLTPLSTFYRIYAPGVILTLGPVSAALAVRLPESEIVGSFGILGFVLLTLYLRMAHRANQQHRDAVAATRGYTGLSQRLTTERTRREALQKHLEEISLFDAVTGLPNQRHFHDRFRFLIRRIPNGSVLTLILINLSGFTQVNNAFGRRAGDHVLTQVGNRLAAVLPRNTALCRLGSDEFAIAAITREDERLIRMLTDSLMDAIHLPMNWDRSDLLLDAVMGISRAPIDGTTLESLLNKADIAMRYAKDQTGLKVLLFDPEMETRVANRFAMQLALRQALDNQELSLVYQPQIRLQDAMLTGAEALLRWNSPVFGNVSPSEFIEVAEQTGLISRIGAWVLRQACQQAKEWHKAYGEGFYISVNVSVHQFADSAFLDTVREALETSGLPPSALHLEITETVVMTEPETVMELLDELKIMGVQIGLDDFGTGYSSLGYLRQLNIDYIKLDKQFISSITTNPQDAAIVRTTISLAKALGLGVVAEGIEDRAQLQQLNAEDCDIGQGYLFSPPVSATRFEALPARYAGTVAEH